MHTAIKKLTEADAELRQALAEIGDQDVPSDVHTAIARARSATIRARDHLLRHERLRPYREGPQVEVIR